MSLFPYVDLKNCLTHSGGLEGILGSGAIKCLIVIAKIRGMAPNGICYQANQVKPTMLLPRTQRPYSLSREPQRRMRLTHPCR